MFARFDENPAMTHQDIKETKRYGRPHLFLQKFGKNVANLWSAAVVIGALRVKSSLTRNNTI